jgi:hypothetical protein
LIVIEYLSTRRRLSGTRRGACCPRKKLQEWREIGHDKDSLVNAPMFGDPKNDDHRVKEESPALELGFKNFDMNWG